MGLPAPPIAASRLSSAKPLVQYDKQLSTGAVGSIWLARLAEGQELGRLVSVRRLSELLVTDQTRERLRQTARACLALRHPSLIKLLAIHEANGELLSISEQLHGVLLHDLKRHLVETQTPMPIAVAVRIVRDAARAGTCARGLAEEQESFQGQRLLYNDAMVVAAFGETLLRDVGVLTMLCHAPLVLETPGLIVGLSPEELSGPRVTHESSEVFSLGILLWELLANRLAFSRRDAQKATSGVISQPVPPLDRVERIGMPIPKELVVLVARAIDRDPRRRIPSLEAFADAIDEWGAPLVGSTEQVGGCIRRLAGGFLGEPAQSSSWSVGAKSDSFAVDSTRGDSLTNHGRDFEPETVADRKLLAGSMLELQSRLDLSEPALGEEDSLLLDADDDVVIANMRKGPRRFLWLVSSLVVAAAAVVGGYRFGVFPSWKVLDRIGTTYHVLPRTVSVRIGETPLPKKAPVAEVDLNAPSLSPASEGSASQELRVGDSTPVDEVPPTKVDAKPAKRESATKVRRAPVKSKELPAKPTDGTPQPDSVVPEQRWGI